MINITKKCLIKNTGKLDKLHNFSITTDNVRRAISKWPSQQKSGKNSMHRFYIKNFSNLHETLTSRFQKLLKDPKHISRELHTGITFMIQLAQNNTHDFKEYKPITCLLSLCKLLTQTLYEENFQPFGANQYYRKKTRTVKRAKAKNYL